MRFFAFQPLSSKALDVASALLLGALFAPAPSFASGTPASPQAAGFGRVGKCTAKFLEGILPDGAGGLWMLDVEGGRILHADKGQACVERAKLEGMPSGEKFAPDGTITIVGRGGIHSFDPRSGTIRRISAQFEGQEITGLNDLAYDQDGGFYFTAPGDSDAFHPTGRVFYRSQRGKITLVASGIAYPDGVAVSPDGNAIAIAEFGKNRIVSVPALHAPNPLKVTFVWAYMSGGYGPDGMTFAPDGRLLVGNFGGGALEILEPRYGLTTLRLPPEAGSWTTNVALRDGQVLILEAQKGEVWQVPLPPLSSTEQ